MLARTGNPYLHHLYLFINDVEAERTLFTSIFYSSAGNVTLNISVD